MHLVFMTARPISLPADFEGQYPINCFKLAVIEALETCAGFLGYVNERIAAAPRPPRARPLRDLAGLRAAAAALAGEA